ncbi:MAG TPA: inositol 2-dehydrogenase [Atribacteraceae bacterium]|nr:inositol 2-dehydrogenase [Atribacteraceae bacterium]
MKQLNTGIIGMGRIGRIHARNLQFMIPDATVSAIAEVDQAVLDQAASELQVPVAKTDYRYLLDDPGIKAVVICSPTDTHVPVVIDAARAGKHIFCEKPVALDIALIDQALAEVSRSGVKLMVGFNRRFDPGFRKARETIVRGDIGVPYLVRITSRDPAPPPLNYIEVSGGLFLDMMIHDFDMARFLLAEEVVELCASSACLVDPAIGKAGDVDTALVLLRYRSGALGAIDNCRRAVYGYDQRIEVLGSAGAVSVGNKTPTELTVAREDAVRSEKPLFFFLERYQEAYLAEMNEFVGCVLEDRTTPVGGLDGRISVAMANAAGESAKKGGFVKVHPPTQ